MLLWACIRWCGTDGLFYTGCHQYSVLISVWRPSSQLLAHIVAARQAFEETVRRVFQSCMAIFFFMCVFCLHTSAWWVCGGQKRALAPLGLWATMQLLGTKPGASAKVVTVLNHWASHLPSHSHFIYISWPFPSSTPVPPALVLSGCLSSFPVGVFRNTYDPG